MAGFFVLVDAKQTFPLHKKHIFTLKNVTCKYSKDTILFTLCAAVWVTLQLTPGNVEVERNFRKGDTNNKISWCVNWNRILGIFLVKYICFYFFVICSMKFTDKGDTFDNMIERKSRILITYYYFSSQFLACYHWKWLS